MARRRGGGFASGGGFGAGSSSSPRQHAGPQAGPATSPTASNPMRGGGASAGPRFNNPANRRGRRNRPGPPKPAGPAAGDGGTGASPLDEQITFEDTDWQRETGLGVLKGLGITAAGSAPKQWDWLENQLQQQVDLANGYTDDSAPFQHQLQRWLAGTGPTATAPATTPLDFAQWRAQNAGVGPKKWKTLAQKRRAGLQRRYNAYAAGLAPATPAPGLGIDPATARARLARDWQSASPLERGYDSRDWRAPRRVIPF